LDPCLILEAVVLVTFLAVVAFRVTEYRVEHVHREGRHGIGQHRVEEVAASEFHQVALQVAEDLRPAAVFNFFIVHC